MVLKTAKASQMYGLNLIVVILDLLIGHEAFTDELLWTVELIVQVMFW